MAVVQDGFKLEVAFASSPTDSAPSWTDITAYWVAAAGVSIKRGRGSEQDKVSTGTMSLTLDNTDGRFTVGNTSSPYYPNVKLRKQIRVTYTQSAVTYPIWKGYVDEWPVEWPDGGELYAWAQVRASDRFKMIGSPRTLRSVPQEEILAPAPSAYFPLSEGEGATVAGDISGSTASTGLTVGQIGTGGTLTFGTGTGPPTDGAGAAQFAAVDTTDGKYLTGITAGLSGGTGRTLVAVFNTSTVADQNLVKMYAGGGNGSMQLSITSGGLLFGLHVSGTGASSPVTGVTNVADGLTHTAHLTFTSGGNIVLYLDGVADATAGTSGANAALSSIDIGGRGRRPDSFGAGDGAFTGTLSHVAAYTSPLDAATCLRQSTAMRNGFAGESTGTRAARVADWCGIATGDRTIDTGSTTSIRHVDTTGKTAQGFLQELADTEAGLVFMDTAGKLQFQSRADRINTTAALTLSASSAQVSPDVMYRSNDQFLLNDVTYNRQGGITYRATDATSITDYGPYTSSQETYTTSDNEVRDHAVWVVNTSKTPTARIEGLGVDMLTDSGSRIAALGLDLSSKITVTNMPTAAPGASTSVFVEGWSETISATEWVRSFNTSPADAYSPLWQLGTAGFGELGTTTYLNF